jgi:hypothetical protein
VVAEISAKRLPGNVLGDLAEGGEPVVGRARRLAGDAAQRTRAAGPLVWLPGPKGSGSGRARWCGLYIVPLGS